MATLYLFRDRYGRPGKGNDKGAIKGMVGYARRNHMVPIPHFASWDDFNADLEGQCRARLTRILRDHKETIGERLQRYERGATLITSNLAFDEWTETFGTERPTGALLDRLTHHVNILEMNGESYRLAQSRARKPGANIN